MPPMKTVLVISPHADDVAAFCGGTVARFADEGWRVVIARVTDDAKDSVGLSVEETIKRNASEFLAAAKILGVTETVELGFPTDSLADVPELKLRERFVYLYRKYRPYVVIGFDPFGIYEGNMDHIACAQAAEEAFWVARFDLHHPEHFAEGLRPFAVCEQWYFARELREINHVVDVTTTFSRRIEAFAAHRTMVRNILESQRLQLETWGRRVPVIAAAIDGDPKPLLDVALRMQAAQFAKAHGLPEGHLGEAFRIVRFGGMEDFVKAYAEPIPGVEQGPLEMGEIFK